MFVVEDGTGKPDANSLASVEYADEYHELRGNTAWAGFDLAKKQQKLVVATDYVCDVYGPALAGRQASGIQALCEPRIGAIVNGYLIDAVTVPVGVQATVAELALLSDKMPLLKNTGRGKKRVKVGPLEVEYDGEGETQTKFVSASLKMAPYLFGASVSSVNAKLVRC